MATGLAPGHLDRGMPIDATSAASCLFSFGLISLLARSRPPQFAVVGANVGHSIQTGDLAACSSHRWLRVELVGPRQSSWWSRVGLRRSRDLVQPDLDFAFFLRELLAIEEVS